MIPHGRRRLALATTLGSAAFVVAIGSLLVRGQRGDHVRAEADPGPVHVHGLGVNPRDGSLMIATHTGLWRLEAGADTPERVGDEAQDTMGFTVVGPDRFFGSGHPDFAAVREKRVPPLLGLIESRDGGESWRPVSLLGQADFHVLRAAGNRLYGFDASSERLMRSVDGGRSWTELRKPVPIVDLAVAPLMPARLAATIGGADPGLYESRDGGRSWARRGPAVGLLAWSRQDRLFLVTGAGDVFVSRDGGRHLELRGEIEGEPAALSTGPSGDLYVALHDGTIKRSRDAGRTWTVQAAPARAT